MTISAFDRTSIERGVTRRDDEARSWFRRIGLEAKPSGPLRVVADVLRSGSFDVVRLWHTAARLHRSAPVGSGIRLLIPLEGEIVVQPDDPSALEVRVSVGCIAYLRRSHSYTLVTDSPGARIEIALESPLLGLLDWEDSGALVTEADPAGRGILLSTVNATFGSSLDADSPAFPLVRAAVEQLTGAVLATSLPRERTETVHTRALALIAAMSADANLSVQEVSERLGVPKRTLQRVFAANGTTVFNEIRRARLATARAVLGDLSAPPVPGHALSGYLRSQRLQRDLRHLEPEASEGLH